MKTLLIIRHAKSSWDNTGINDFDRPLNDRGKRDAPAMAQRLIRAGVKIDSFVSSPAKRARTTAEVFIKEFNVKGTALQLIPELYHAQVQNFKDVVKGLDPSYDTVAIFSHNPGITAFANVLSSVRLDNMPTCSVFAVTAQVSHWNEFIQAGPTFWFFDYPKSPGQSD